MTEGLTFKGIVAKAFAVAEEDRYYIQIEVWSANSGILWSSHRFPALSLDHALAVVNTYNNG